MKTSSLDPTSLFGVCNARVLRSSNNEKFSTAAEQSNSIEKKLFTFMESQTNFRELQTQQGKHKMCSKSERRRDWVSFYRINNSPCFSYLET